MAQSIDSPINAYSAYIKKKFGQRVQKIGVDAGFTCPNRDGSKGVGGCTYCNNDSFSSGSALKSVREQLEEGIRYYKNRHKKLEKFVAYFQSYSNTYAPLSHLKKLYEEALKVEGVCGLSIGTRPDCVSEEILDYLASLSKEYDITVEYGLESANDETLKRINRGHNFKDFDWAMKETMKRNLSVCLHVILSLTGETLEDMMNSAQAISRYKVDFLKIHQLHIVKKTIMAQEYLNNPFKILNKEEYFFILKEFLERISPETVIQRLFGQAPSDIVIAGDFKESLGVLHTEFLNYLKSEQSFQGKLFF